MDEIQLSANRLREGIAKNVASLFSKTVHQFHEKCFGTVAENETTRGNLKTKQRAIERRETKARTRKMKGMSATIDNTFSSISPSYNSNGVVDDLDLSKVQLLTLHQVKQIKYIVQSEKLAENVKGLFLQT